jgi:hypothetical protein
MGTGRPRSVQSGDTSGLGHSSTQPSRPGSTRADSIARLTRALRQAELRWGSNYENAVPAFTVEAISIILVILHGPRTHTTAVT